MNEIQIIGKTKQRKSLHSFSVDDTIHVQPITEDPKSEDFMGFRIVKTSKNKKKQELSRFRADNIVHMRNFMASLGGSGAGLFSSKEEDGKPVEVSKAKWDVDEIPEEEDEVFIKQVTGTMAAAHKVFAVPTNDNIHSYADAINRIPVAFYYNDYTGITLSNSFIKERRFPGTQFPKYDADSPLSKTIRRPENDTFLQQPYPSYLVSIGYGKEVGLPDGVQEVFDPYLDRQLFLDHNESMLILHNPRQRDPYCPPIKASVYNLEGGIQYKMPSEVHDLKPSTVIEAAMRAKSKTVGCKLSACGTIGCPGTDGKPGSQGNDGYHGKDGSLKYHGSGGSRGYIGGDGANGVSGKKGTSGRNAILVLNGTPENLQVTGSINQNINLGGVLSEHILFVDCHGGNGGQGGAGGRGGNGGSGGNGGKGRNGVIAGEDGGHGADGGDGGDGGRGGDAGDGGQAGNGGNCVIKTADARLLMLVEVDCMSGDPGNAAQRGAGGTGGNGGRGGKGGNGASGDGDVSGGRGGRAGTRGDPGRYGSPGRNSKNEEKGECGGILWMVLSPINNTIIDQSGSRYDARVETLIVVSALNGGIYEPNERITVAGVVVSNIGGLDLPAGATVSMLTSDSIKFEPTQFSIPKGALKSGKRYTIPFEFYGRIKDIPPPHKPEKEFFEAEIEPTIELLGRSFEKSCKHKLSVQYPVQLNRLICPENMGRGEITSISIEVNNISKFPYGKTSSGQVVLHLHFDARIIPLGVDASANSTIPYEVTYDDSLRDSMYIEISEIPPRNKITVNIKIQMESHAELFDICKWQADLYLREKFIQYGEQHIRVIPVYSSQKEPADVLLVTMADAPIDTVEAAEEPQQGNKFIVNDRLITRCQGKMKDYERV